MKKVLLAMLVAAGGTMLTAGCGNGGGGSEAPAVDGVFGKLPQITAEYGDKAIALMEELGNVGSVDEAKAVSEKGEAFEKEQKAAFEAEIAQLKNKEIPAEVADSVPYKVTANFKIDTEKTEDDQLVMVAQVENTADTYRGFHDGKMDDKSKYDTKKTGAVLVDADGNTLCTPYRTTYSHDTAQGEDLYATGSKGKITVKVKFEPWNAEWLAKAAKVRIVSTESELYKATRKATDQADRDFFSKMIELKKQTMEKIKNNGK